jgi:hypothetical protein
VVIRASSARQIEALLADLAATSDVIREAAVARLTLIGGRAVERLIALADSPASIAARAAAFRTLEATADPRALEPALRAVGDADPEVAAAAIGVARRFLRGARGAAAVDRLTATVLDLARPDSVRVAALRALRDLEPGTIAPLLKSLAGDPVVAMNANQALSDDVQAIHQMIVSRGGGIALGELLRIVEQLREREAAQPPSRRAEWATARAAAHLALAKRGSRIALYDLRESLEAARQPLPIGSLAALTLIGDVSCLEPIAVAYARSRDRWWRGHLADVFRAIVKREGLTRRHAAVKKAARRSAELVSTL